MRRGERRKGWRKFWKNDDKKTDEMDRKECRKMMKTNKGRRWKMKKNVGWGVCMKAIYCWAWPSTTKSAFSLRLLKPCCSLGWSTQPETARVSSAKARLFSSSASAVQQSARARGPTRPGLGTAAVAVLRRLPPGRSTQPESGPH